MAGSILLSGPDADASAKRALDWADDAAGSDPNSVLCLTQGPQRANDLDERWQRGHDPLRFTACTLDQFVAERYEEATATLSDSTLGKAERFRLVEAAIESYEHTNGPLAGVKQPSNDLVDHVQGLFSLLEYAGYPSTEAIQRALHVAGIDGDDSLDPGLFGSFRDADEPEEHGSLAVQAETVSELYQEYQRLRTELHPDWKTVRSEQYLHLLDEDLLVESIPSTIDAIVLHGLTLLAPAEREVVARIARSVPTVAVVPLVHETLGGSGVDHGVERSLEVYQAIGFALDYDVPEHVDEDRLRALRSVHVPVQDQRRYSPDDVGIEWLQPSTEREEVRTVARRIRELLARDVDPSEIGVVVTDRDTYRGVLREVFSAYDVPFTFTNGAGIEQTLVGGALEALLDLAGDDPRATSLRALCSNSLVSASDLGVEPERLEAVENTGGSVDALLDELRAADADTAENVEDLLDALDPDGQSLGEYVDKLRETLEYLGIGTSVDEFGRRGVASSSYQPTYERSAWECVETVLASFEPVAAHVADDDVVGRIRRALRAEMVSPPAQERDYVRVRPLTEAESTSFEHCFLIGLTSGYFPTEQDTMAFFGAINDADEEFRRAHTGRRAHYILGTLLAGSTNVVLSTPQHSVEGAEHVPAPVVTELRQYVDGPEERDSREQEPSVSTEDLQRRYASWASTQQFEDPQFAAEVLGEAEGTDRTALRFGRQGLETTWRRSRADLTAHHGQVESVVDEVYPASRRETFSPSALEDYARCPFVFMCKRVLGFEEDYGERDGVSRADRGTYVHDVLAAFYRELRSGEHAPIDLLEHERASLEAILLEAALDNLDEIGDIDTPFAERTVTRILSGLGSEDENPYFAHGDSEQEDGLLVRFLDEELDAASQREARPTYFEAGIGTDYAGVESLIDGPLAVDTPSGPVGIRGTADRIDVVPGDPRGIYVVDYKTGSTPAGDDVRLGTKLQLPLYGLALESVLEEQTGTEHETLGGTYYSLKSPDDVDPLGSQVTSREAVGDHDDPPLVEPPSQAWRLPFDQRSEVTQFVREVTPARLGRIAAGIGNGAFHTTLHSERQANCEDCTFRSACDVRHHHRQDVIEGLEDAEHYVPERASGDELELDAYVQGGEE